LANTQHVDHDGKQEQGPSKGLIWLWRTRIRRAW
jgi:hypothetical protein